MAEEAEEQAPDITQLWRDWLTQSERQFNAFFTEMMGSETFARSSGGSMEAFAGFQRVMAQGMERYLAFINVPSKTDLVNVAEALRTIDERLARIEETLQLAAEAVDGTTSAPPPVREPRRTRRAEGATAAKNHAETEPIPEELRR